MEKRQAGAERPRESAQEAREAKQAGASLVAELARRRAAANATPPDAPPASATTTTQSQQPQSDKAPPEHRALSAQQQRVVETVATPEVDERGLLLYQHSVLCQTYLPYRDPGEVRKWTRVNGQVHLEIAAGSAMDPRLEQLVELGIPFGPKPRIVLMHLNGEAMRAQSPVIEVEDSLTAFVKRALGRADGKTIKAVKEQLARLAASRITLGSMLNGQAVTLKTDIIEGFDIWLPKNPKQRVLWPTTIQFSPRYFESLQRHAVPLDEHHIGALSANGLALDIYAWLAQRLHRIAAGKPVLVPWPALHTQFGGGYVRLVDFRRAFRSTLPQVLTLYQRAKVGCDGRGLMLSHSPPVVPPRVCVTV